MICYEKKDIICSVIRCRWYIFCIFIFWCFFISII